MSLHLFHISVSSTSLPFSLYLLTTLLSTNINPEVATGLTTCAGTWVGMVPVVVVVTVPMSIGEGENNNGDGFDMELSSESVSTTLGIRKELDTEGTIVAVVVGNLGNTNLLEAIGCGPNELFKVSSSLFLEGLATGRGDVLFLTTLPLISEPVAITDVLVVLVLDFEGSPSTSDRVPGFCFSHSLSVSSMADKDAACLLL